MFNNIGAMFHNFILFANTPIDGRQAYWFVFGIVCVGIIFFILFNRGMDIWDQVRNRRAMKRLRKRYPDIQI